MVVLGYYDQKLTEMAQYLVSDGIFNTYSVHSI